MLTNSQLPLAAITQLYPEECTLLKSSICEQPCCANYCYLWDGRVVSFRHPPYSAVLSRYKIHSLQICHFLHLVMNWFCLLWTEMRRWHDMLLWHMYASLTSWNNKYTACLHRGNEWFLKRTYIFYSLVIVGLLYISLLKSCIFSKVFSHCGSQSNKIMIIGFINVSFVALWVKFTCTLMNWRDLNEYIFLTRERISYFPAA